MKNFYITSHFPLISILFFSLAFAVYTERLVTGYLQEIGLYSGMVEFFSEQGIVLVLVGVLWIFFFMLFAALKLIADTVNELSLLFFSKEEEGVDIRVLRGGSWIFLIGGILALPAVLDIRLLAGVFAAACFSYFIFFVYRVSPHVRVGPLIGLMFFHLLFWLVFVSAIGFLLLRLYSAVISSLPV
ncbi:DUF5366 family protein [Bacillus daqingensis]|uniref:DUF5366 family protein n=1 Tax=Bacillus daqingensis TaxID=872396 RepID=A0ABV9P091_9BACI